MKTGDIYDDRVDMHVVQSNFKGTVKLYAIRAAESVNDDGQRPFYEEEDTGLLLASMTYTSDAPMPAVTTASSLEGIIAPDSSVAEWQMVGEGEALDMAMGYMPWPGRDRMIATGFRKLYEILESQA